MNKTIKKLLSSIVAASLLASSIAMSAGAASMTYSDGKLTYSSDKDQTAVLLKASYTDDGAFSGVTVVNKAVELKKGENTLDVTAVGGDKLFLWDGLKNITPLADVLTVAKEELPTPTPTGSTTTPSPTPDAQQLPSWKFDFGSAEDVAEGYTAVTADTNYTTNGTYGFIGNNENDYKLSGRIDAFGMQEGQLIQLSAGGGTGLNDAIGSTGADSFNNAGDKYYPTRFALKVEDEQYFKVKATVTTLDPSKEATVSLYTERKHPIFTKKTIAAGETYTAEFTIRTTPIYYQKSEPSGSIADGMVNVAVMGENSALAALEIEQIESAPTVWVLGDSTVTDGNCLLPYYEGPNYTGVGTGLTKYLPSTVAMVNEGEGGLAAGDNYHYNMVANRIKAGDYMYLEYGHNHKTDGTEGYLACLDKYYNKCHEVGATLIIVSPIERINTFSDNAYQHSLRGFAEAGEKYVADKVAAGATDIAYVDLNRNSLAFYNKICTKADGTVDANLIKFYFQAAKGASDCDHTHPNDYGAESLAYEFFKAALAVEDETQKAALSGILTNMSTEVPTLVSDEIIAGGLGGDAWPQYVPPIDQEFPVVIKDVKTDESGNVSSVDVKVQQAKITMSGYGIIVITVYNEDGTEKGKIYAQDQVDNSTGYGNQTVKNFTKDVTIGENDTYEAIVLPAIDSPEGLKVDETSEVVYSAVYKPTGISTYILPGEDSDVETFDYYGKTSLTEISKYVYGGSNGSAFTLGKDANDIPYTTIEATGSGNSWFLMRPLENLVDEEGTAVGTGSTGRYMVSADMIYNSGSGLTFAMAKNTTPSKSPFVAEQFDMFKVNSGGVITVNGTEVGTVSAIDWTNIKFIIDLGSGVAEVSVAGSTPVTVDMPYYQSFTVPTMDTLKHLVLSGDRSATFDVKLSNLVVAKLKDSDEKATLTASVDESCASYGSVYTTDENTTSNTVAKGEAVSATAVAKAGYVFTGWKANGTVFSEEPTVTVRVCKDVNLVATFEKQSGIDGVTDYAITMDNNGIKTGSEATVTLGLANVIDKAGNPVVAGNTDVTWSCDDANITVSNDGVVTIPEAYTMDTFKKVVTVTGTLNNISKSVRIKLYSSKYFENFSVTTAAEWITNSSTNAITETIDTFTDTKSYLGMTADANGKVISIGNNSNGTGKKFEYERDMGVSDKSVVNFGFDIEPYPIRNDGKKASVTLQFVDTEGTKVFDITVNTAGSNSSFNGTEVAGFKNGTVISVDTTLDFTNKTMTYTLTDSTGKVLKTGTAELTATNLAKMSFSGDWQYGKFALDNVYLDYAE